MSLEWGDINRKGNCLAAWESACRPKIEGGLGIVDLKTQNIALLLKYMDKFYNHADLPWVQLTWDKIYRNQQTPPQARSPCGSFWWKDIMKLFNYFKSFSISIPNRGNSVAFWLDNWSGIPLNLRFPQLFSFVKKPKSSMLYFINNELDRTFRLPLSSIAVTQLTEVQELLDIQNPDNNADDSWTYQWGAVFCPSKAYKNLRGTHEASPLFKWLWTSNNLGKHKFFFWLLLRDRLNTRNILRRKNRILEDYSCVLCNGSCEETLEHLFFTCPFSQNCWHSLHIYWNTGLQPLDMVIEARTNFGHPIFRELMITACWIIWKMRNSIIFDNGTCSLHLWKTMFKEELGLVCIKAKDVIKGPLNIWRDSFL